MERSGPTSGKLHAVIDFGALSVGSPDAEHTPLWGSARARGVRARVAVGAAGLPCYRDTLFDFAAECRASWEAVLADVGTR
ncbi:hypothetical protein [Streptomyces sp. NPDC058373]|uniref:hypothetical protein n=1 Tax=Streptomyces sp. NPDC058373 TaxID=3346465 RepID=UPI003652530A